MHYPRTNLLNDRNATKKNEFVALEIQKLKKSEDFLLLDEAIQQEIINNLQIVSKKRDVSLRRYFSTDEAIIYSIFFMLVLFLISNFFLSYIHIPKLIYFFFYALVVWTFFLIVITKRKSRIKEVWNMVSSWDELPKPARNDFVEVVKNEIEISHVSIGGKIMYGEFSRYAVYVLLLILIGNTIYQEREFGFRLFFVMSLSCLIFFILMIPVSIIKEISGDKKITQKDFICIYLMKLDNSYKKLLATIVVFLTIMGAFATMYPIS